MSNGLTFKLYNLFFTKFSGSMANDLNIHVGFTKFQGNPLRID